MPDVFKTVDKKKGYVKIKKTRKHLKTRLREIWV